MKIKGKEVNWKFIEKTGKFVSDNGSTLSMVGGIVSLGLALYAAFKASQDVCDIREDYDEKVKEIQSEAVEGDKSREELKVLRTERNIRYILAYKWVLLAGGASAGLIFLTKYLDGLAISGLTAVAMSQQEKIKSLVERTKEVVGEEKFNEIQEKTFEDLVAENFNIDGEPIAIQPIAGAGEIWIDGDTGKLIQIHRKDLEEAIKLGEKYYARNHEIYRHKWWGILGLEPPEGSRNKCWGPKNPFKASLTQQPIYGCVFNVIEYENNSQMPEYAGILKRKYKEVKA